MGNFLLGEAKLEQYLEEHMPYDASSDAIAASKTGLSEAKQFLTLSAGIEGSRTTGSMDAQLLLAKLHFACGKQCTVKILFLSFCVFIKKNCQFRRIQ